MIRKNTLNRGVLLFGALALGMFARVAKVSAAENPSPALLITYYGDERKGETGALAIADPLSGKVVYNLPLTGGGNPHQVTVSADGKLAFVTSNRYAHEYCPESRPDMAATCAPDDPNRVLP